MGWIKLDRQLCSHWLWTEGAEPFDKRSAWVDLLLMANHEDGKALVGGQLVKTNRGEVNRSIRSLAARWHWSQGKVRRFLELLAADRMIEIRSGERSTNGAPISIVNYKAFQTSDNAQRSTERSANGAPTEHVQESKEDTPPVVVLKELKNNSFNPTTVPPTGVTRFLPPSEADVAAYVAEMGYKNVDPEAFVAFYESKGWLVGKSKMKDWKAAVRGWNSRHNDRHEKQSHGQPPKKEFRFTDLLEGGTTQ